MMPQMSDQLEQSVHSASNITTESSDQLLKPGHKSPRQRSVEQTPPSENGSVATGKARSHSNGLVVSASGSVQSQGKSHMNGYVWDFCILCRTFSGFTVLVVLEKRLLN